MLAAQPPTPTIPSADVRRAAARPHTTFIPRDASFRPSSRNLRMLSVARADDLPLRTRGVLRGRNAAVDGPQPRGRERGLDKARWLETVKMLFGGRRKEEDLRLSSRMPQETVVARRYSDDVIRIQRDTAKEQKAKKPLRRAATFLSKKKAGDDGDSDGEIDHPETPSSSNSENQENKDPSVVGEAHADAKSFKAVFLDDDPFRILNVDQAPLGEGASGTVYKAKTPNGQAVALKVIRDPTPEDEIEVAIMQKLSHASLMRCYMTYRWQGDLYVAMDLMQNGSVYTHLERCRKRKVFLGEICISYILREVLRGLFVLHREKVIHGDLKPDNMLVSPTRSIKLADFGSSIVLQNRKAGRLRMGTPHWMAPEAARREAATTRADIWSVGIVAVELADTEPPLMHLNRGAVMKMLADGGYPQPRSTTSRTFLFQDFVYQCTAMDPKRRPSARELLTHPFITQLNDLANPSVWLDELCLHS